MPDVLWFCALGSGHQGSLLTSSTCRRYVVPCGQPSLPSMSHLLEHLRFHLGDRELKYTEEPRRLTKGMFAQVWQFSLASATPEWSRHVVLRVYPSEADPCQVHVEAAVQNGLVAEGFPAPKVLVSEDSGAVPGRPFVVMERIAGRPVLRGLRWDLFLRDLPRVERTWPSTLPRSQHGSTTARHEVWRPRRRGADSNRTDIRSSSSRRWRSQAANIIYRGSELSGVVDWDRATLGEPALDIGFARAGWALMPAPARVPPPRQ